MPDGSCQRLSFSSILVIYDNPDLIRVTSPRKEIDNAQIGEHDVPRYILGEFCLPCSKLNLSGLFEPVSVFKPKRRGVGSIAQCESTKAYCQFCRFLIQACELAYPRETNEAFWNDDARKRLIHLANDPVQRPWYRAIAVDVDLPLVPYAWLQVGLPRVQRDHWVCVNTIASANPTCAKSVELPRLRSQGSDQSNSLDYELIKTWQRICLEQHGEKCNKSTVLARRFLKLYVIDVRSRTIKVAERSDPYFALSYVWGSVARPPREVWNWEAFCISSPDGRHEIALPDVLPRTVEDAITFTDRLNERYLWVDAFCINQHDSQHQMEQISNMDLVYQCARLTIIALDGNGSDAGIAGISRPLQQVSQPTVESSVGTLVATHLPAAWMPSEVSPWDRRAWTMQESLLSRRCIILDRNQMIWKCQEEYIHDAMNVDPSPQRPRSVLSNEYFWDNCISIDISRSEWAFSLYSDFLSLYSGRQLTIPSDVLSACRGILNHLTKNTSMEFVHGLPKNNILPALMWKAHPQHCLRLRNGFPTWTWAGWEGRIEYTYWLHDIESLPGLSLEGEAHCRRKRPRLAEHTLLKASIPEPATVMNDLTEVARQEIQIASSVAKFRLKLIRKQGKALKYLKYGSLQQREAVGDQWTLLDSEGAPMRDIIGECATFENTDHFFQVHPEISALIQSQDSVVDLVFIKFWPFIRDSEQSNHWERNIVGALVLLGTDCGRKMRIASLVLPLSDWLNANPTSAMVTIV